MKHFVCTLAYGDCLLTLSQLELRTGSPDWRIIGTAVTRRVAELLDHPLPVHEMLPDKAAFNTIKERGISAAVRDYLHVRRELPRLTRAGDVLVFERAGWRNRGLVPAGRQAIYAQRSDSAYADRRDLVQSVFGGSFEWRAARRPADGVRQVLVNPCARYRRRWLSGAVVDNIIRLCAEHGWRLTLVDPCAEYGMHAASAARYIANPQLSEAAARLREADLYIGPDSFFLHLAYYYGVPHFAFFYTDNLYFMTPGMRELGNWATFAQAETYSELAPRVAAFACSGAAPRPAPLPAHPSLGEATRS